MNSKSKSQTLDYREQGFTMDWHKARELRGKITERKMKKSFETRNAGIGFCILLAGLFAAILVKCYA